MRDKEKLHLRRQKQILSIFFMWIIKYRTRQCYLYTWWWYERQREIVDDKTETNPIYGNIVFMWNIWHEIREYKEDCLIISECLSYKCCGCEILFKRGNENIRSVYSYLKYSICLLYNLNDNKDGTNNRDCTETAEFEDSCRIEI